VFLRHAFPAYFVMPGKCNANNMQHYRSFFKIQIIINLKSQLFIQRKYYFLKLCVGWCVLVCEWLDLEIYQESIYTHTQTHACAYVVWRCMSLSV
jgi:hypothetical protein